MGDINNRANYNNRKSPDLKIYYHNPKILLSNSKLNNKGQSPYDRKNKENKNNILKLNNFSNNGMKALHKKKVSSISPSTDATKANRPPLCWTSSQKTS